LAVQPPLLEAVIEGLQEVKGHRITVLDLREVPHAVAAWFVVAHGTSRTQVEALAHAVEGHRTDRLVIAGAANLVRTEHDFTSSVYPLLEAIEAQVTLLKLFTEMQWETTEVQARIGRENQGPLSEAAILASAYQSGSERTSTVGVVGPTRMDYSNNMTAVRAVARYLSKLLGDDEKERA